MQFLAAVARRIRADVSRPVGSIGEPMLPSPHMLSHSIGDRAAHMHSDLRYMQNELAMGEAQPATVFTDASAAMTDAVQRFASVLPSSAAASCNNPLFSRYMRISLHQLTSAYISLNDLTRTPSEWLSLYTGHVRER